MSDKTSYETLFSQLELQTIRAGNASAWQAGISILAEKENLERTETTFSKLVLARLADDFKTVKKFVCLVESYLDKDFITVFTNGPRYYEREGANHVTLDKIRLRELARVFEIVLIGQHVRSSIMRILINGIQIQ